MQRRDRARKRSRILSASLLAVSLAMIGVALFPVLYRTEVFPVSSNLLPQEYQLEVRYPWFAPSGEQAEIAAYFRPEGATDTGSIPSDFPGMAVAEVQSATLSFEPAGQISVPLIPGRQLSFSWQTVSGESGLQQFSLFLFHQGAKEVEGVLIQQPLWAQSFTWQAFPGLGSLRYPVLFLAAFGALFGLGILLGNTLR